MGISTKKKNFYIKLSLIILIGGAFLYYYYSYNPSIDTTRFVSCPSKSILGFNCPGCGSQRLIHHLLHFELGQAFSYNPLLFISLPFVGFILIQFISNTIFGTHYRTKLFYNNKFVLFVFILLLVYAVLRNIPFEPFSYLAPPE